MDRAAANVNSITTARLAQLVLQVAHGFSGSKRAAPKISPQEFLPYPNWRPTTTEVEGPDDPTKFVLTELGKARRIPIHVLTALLTPVQQKP